MLSVFSRHAELPLSRRRRTAASVVHIHILDHLVDRQADVVLTVSSPRFLERRRQLRADLRQVGVLLEVVRAAAASHAAPRAALVDGQVAPVASTPELPVLQLLPSNHGALQQVVVLQIADRQLGALRQVDPAAQHKRVLVPVRPATRRITRVRTHGDPVVEHEAVLRVVAEGVVAPRVHQALQNPGRNGVLVRALRVNLLRRVYSTPLRAPAPRLVISQVSADLVAVAVLVLRPHPFHNAVNILTNHLVLAVGHELVQDYLQVHIVGLQQGQKRRVVKRDRPERKRTFLVALLDGFPEGRIFGRNGYERGFFDKYNFAGRDVVGSEEAAALARLFLGDGGGAGGRRSEKGFFFVWIVPASNGEDLAADNFFFYYFCPSVAKYYYNSRNTLL